MKQSNNELGIKILDSSKIEIPVIRITKKAKDKIDLVVETCSQEVSWLGFVEFTNPNIYTITDIKVLPQNVTSTFTEIEPSGINDWVNDILTKLPQKEALSKINTILFWGHSHVNMACNPSGVDDAELDKKKDFPYYIGGIFNKSGEYRIEFRDHRKNMAFTNLKLEVESSLTEDEKKDLLKDIKDNVHSKPVEVVKSFFSSMIDDATTNGSTHSSDSSSSSNKKSKSKTKEKSTSKGEWREDPYYSYPYYKHSFL